MSPDKDILENRLTHIREKIGQIKALTENTSVEEFKANFEKHNAVLHLLQVCIEACTDIANHICSYDNLGVPSTYSEAFEILETHRIISKDLSSELREAVRFRNRIVHLYQVLDLETVLTIAKTKPPIFSDFIIHILKYLE